MLYSKKKLNLKDYVAIVFQHEYDHLNGILHMDVCEENMLMSREERKEFRWNYWIKHA